MNFLTHRNRLCELDKMRRQRNMPQRIGQNHSNRAKEVEVSSMLDREFKVTAIKIFTRL